jgi:hypothetical protein
MLAGEALPRAPGSRARLIALCVASWWEPAPLVTQKKAHARRTPNKSCAYLR